MSQNNPIIHVGLDVAKASFVVDLQGRCQQLTNDAQGHGRLCRLLPQLPAPVHVVLEATGGYEQPIVAALHQAQIALSVVLPGRVRAFAKARGQRAKTDPIDAALLSAYGQAIVPAPTPPRSAHAQLLQETVRQRQQLVELRTQLQNQAAHDVSAQAQKRHARLRKALDKEIADCEQHMARLQAEDPQLTQRAQRLQEVPGVGPIVAAVLVAEFPELGSLPPGEVAALAGLAPYNCDSGPRKGTRHIAGGRAPVRRALYMAALTARRKDGILKTFYEGLLQRGKPKLVALTAVMRKLIVLLNRLLKDPTFQLQPPPDASAS
jgi:transposase